MNNLENFIKFEVSLNEAPIKSDIVGKDIVVDWFFLDGFNSDKKFWIDSNGLEMV